MISKRRKELEILLQDIAESLDITEDQYKDAVRHYEEVGEWLNDEGELSIKKYQPEIYPQGSFNIGTMIKPINDTDDYDIDLVCELKSLSKEDTSQNQLKDMVGNRLKEHSHYKKIIKEGNRCWTLQYSNSTRFHMDILPSIPDPERSMIGERIGEDLASSAILITDKELFNWQKSNPVGYAEWFKEQMKVIFHESRIVIAKSLSASIEEVPDYKVKTPLQRSIQILKRHRDIMFANDKEDSPISIIISTLAAKAYENEASLLDALENIVERMPDYIESDEEGYPAIYIPVNSSENYANKWKENPQLQTKFMKWLDKVQLDINNAINSSDREALAESLKPGFGDRLVIASLKNAFPEQKASTRVIGTIVPPVVISNPSKPWRK